MIIGITGGSGSGKSTVTIILKHLGAKAIFADKVAREVVCKGKPALKELVEHFDGEILDENGELDRRKLASVVFGEPEKLSDLNNITHKYIVEKIAAKISRLYEKNSAEVIVLDVPIPVKHGFLDLADTIWVVTADREVRIKRIMQRDNLSYEEAVSRIDSQLSEGEYLKIADEVLVNNGNMEQLEKETIKLFFKVKGVQSDTGG